MKNKLEVAIAVAGASIFACFILFMYFHCRSFGGDDTTPPRLSSVEALSSVAYVVIGYEGNLPMMQSGVVPPPKNGTGLASPVDADGYYVAAAHSIDPTQTVYLMGSFDGRFQALQARVVFRGDPADIASDFAVLKIDAASKVILPPAEVLPKLDEKLVAVVRRDGSTTFEECVCKAVPVVGKGSFVQTDLHCIPGDSGGPLLNRRMELVGLASRGMSLFWMRRTLHCCPPWPKVRELIAGDKASVGR